MIAITVEIARRDRRHDILIGDFLPDRWPEAIEKQAPSDKHFAVVDRRVAQAHGIEAVLAGRTGWATVPFDAGEEHKGWREYADLCESLIRLGIDRKSVVVAIGGGVTGDVAGFAAATILRGVRFAQVPTTLVAQVDSSVGGKTGIDIAGGKNLLGAFHQPETVLVEPGFLSTLPEREFRAGLAEAIKYGIIADADFFERLAASPESLLRRDPAPLAEIVAHCCRMKADIVGRDERDVGRRALLNHGHTFGHALEALAGYDGSLLHGEAVGMGMILAAEFAAASGLADSGQAERTAAVLRRFGIPGRLSDLPPPAGAGADWREGISVARLCSALEKDKKSASAGLTLILPRRIGDCRAEGGFSPEEVAEFILSRLALRQVPIFA
ncbi:MAG: 3-dehydroquinate synthase [Planctomycetota bacterium]|jgi:3-dehydroquinate synthase|nr:3-dehydroquinate synthase [Planctomycetota bacterium]